MSNIESSFIKQLEAEAHIVFQQTGTKLRSSVRTKGGAKGSSTTFQKIGLGGIPTPPTRSIGFEALSALSRILLF